LIRCTVPIINQLSTESYQSFGRFSPEFQTQVKKLLGTSANWGSTHTVKVLPIFDKVVVLIENSRQYCGFRFPATLQTKFIPKCGSFVMSFSYRKAYFVDFASPSR
jgi:hypothetical protein